MPPTPDTFAARLRALREQAGLSVSELAARSGLRRQAVHMLEAGQRSPTLTTVQKLAEALGVSLSAFDGLQIED